MRSLDTDRSLGQVNRRTKMLKHLFAFGILVTMVTPAWGTQIVCTTLSSVYWQIPNYSEGPYDDGPTIIKFNEFDIEEVSSSFCDIKSFSGVSSESL